MFYLEFSPIRSIHNISVVFIEDQKNGERLRY